MSALAIILIVLVVVLLIGVVPQWPHAAGWGYAPSGILLLVLIVVVLLVAFGRL
jgi:hypothetical protein